MEMVEEGQNQPKIATFEEIAEEGREDQISVLPDSLLVDIVSRLDSTEEAIRTGTLSNRWKHIWTGLPVLKFTYSEYKRRLFGSFIDKTLAQCRQSKLKRFDLDAGNCDPSPVNSWIRYAIRCNVEELYLRLRGISDEDEFRLDQSFFTNSSFRDLTLRDFILNPNGAISWTNLRSLCICDGKLDEDMIENILSGSPQLETLALESCYGFSRLDITSKSIKKLVLYGYREIGYCDYDDIDEIDEINAPSILSLTIKDVMGLSYPLLLNVSSVLEAELDFTYVCDWKRTHREELLKSVILNSHVKELKVGPSCSKGQRERVKFLLDQKFFTASCFVDLKLSSCIFNPTGAISWKNLKRLCISCGIINEDLIENILAGSPLLEILALGYCSGYKRLDITSKSVKCLIFISYMDPKYQFDASVIEINAPNIVSLSIQGTLVLWKLLLVDVSSLVEAELDYVKIGYSEITHEKAEEEMLKGLILNLRHVEELDIGESCHEVLYRLVAKGFNFTPNMRFPGVTYDYYDSDSVESEDCDSGESEDCESGESEDL